MYPHRCIYTDASSCSSAHAQGYLKLSPEKKAEVVQGLDVSVDELTRRVEELARLH